MEKKISIVTAVMNRPERAIRCVRSWLHHDIFDEIILIDWSSEIPLDSFEELKSNEKLNIIRVEGKEEFNLGQAYNYGILSTKNELILKIDIDHVLGLGSFIQFLKKAIDSIESKYITGRKGRGYYHGLSFFRKSDFIEAGLFNENLNGWGYDNEDLYNRMNKKLVELPIDPYPFVYHNPHKDDLRVENYKEKQKNWSYEKNKLTVTHYLNHLG